MVDPLDLVQPISPIQGRGNALIVSLEQGELASKLLILGRERLSEVIADLVLVRSRLEV